TDEIRLARVNQQSRRFDLQIFAFHVKWLPSRTNAFVRPLATWAQIRSRAGYMKVAFHSPPLRALVDVGDGFEDARWRSRDEDLRQDRVMIGSQVCSRHSLSLLTAAKKKLNRRVR